MKIYNNFTPYAPEGDDLPANVLFLRSDTGVDWYDAQKEFKESTLKVMFDSAGVICCAEIDASGLWPVNCSVAEIDSKKVPVDFVVGAGSWVFDGRKVLPVPVNHAAEAEKQRARLMLDAEAIIAPLQRAVKYNIDTLEEARLLEEWEIYTVVLSRIDTSRAPDIDWPEPPAIT